MPYPANDFTTSNKVLLRLRTVYPYYRLRSNKALPSAGPDSIRDVNDAPAIAGTYTAANSTPTSRFFRSAK